MNTTFKLTSLAVMLMLSNLSIADSNISDIYQDGDGNTAETIQTATISGYISITQEGSDNSATALQDRIDSSDATIDTTGTGNTSDIKQINSYGVTANIMQEGDFNNAEIRQRGHSDFSTAVIEQTTNLHPDYVADSNDALIIQRAGTDADAEILQQYGTGFSDATIEQVSAIDISFASIVQWDAYLSSATIYQSGSEQQAYIDQDFTTGTVASIEQYGDLDYADIQQLPDTYDSMASVFQDGSSNEAYITQDAVSSTVFDAYDPSATFAKIDQIGNSNIADVLQEVGIDLQATVSQTGDLNDALVTQSGSSNITSIEQIGTGNIASVNQSGFGAAGFENIATIAQYGSYDEASITQLTGAANIATITQNP